MLMMVLPANKLFKCGYATKVTYQHHYRKIRDLINQIPKFKQLLIDHTVYTEYLHQSAINCARNHTLFPCLNLGSNTRKNMWPEQLLSNDDPKLMRAIKRYAGAGVITKLRIGLTLPELLEYFIQGNYWAGEGFIKEAFNWQVNTNYNLWPPLHDHWLYETFAGRPNVPPCFNL